MKQTKMIRVLLSFTLASMIAMAHTLSFAKAGEEAKPSSAKKQEAKPSRVKKPVDGIKSAVKTPNPKSPLPSPGELMAIVFSNLEAPIEAGPSSSDSKTTVASFLELTLASLAEDGNQEGAEIRSKANCEAVPPNEISSFADFVETGSIFPKNIADSIRKSKDGLWDCTVGWGAGAEAVWDRDLRFLLTQKNKKLLPGSMAYHYMP